MLLLVSCSNDLDIAQETWDIVISRSVTNNENVLVIGKKQGHEKLRGVLCPSDSEGENAQWQGEKPSWPGDEELEMFVVTPNPDDGVLPQKVNVTEQKVWMIDYVSSTCKPKHFSLKHLMAKLQVHIRIEDAPESAKPLNVQMALHTEAFIDYPNKCLNNLSGRDYNTLNFKIENFERGDNGNWVSSKILVLPQVLEQGKPCLSFTIDGEQKYVFTPKTDLILIAGKINHLYLGAAYSGQILLLLNENLNITDWVYDDNNGGDAVELK